MDHSKEKGKRLQMYEVQVWFATSSDYRPVGRFPELEAALREARAYLSDSRGIRILDHEGHLMKQVK